MEQNKRNNLLIAALVIGIVYWIFWLISVISGINADISFSKTLEDGESYLSKSILISILLVTAVIIPSILTFIGWKKNNNILLIIAAVVFFLTLNFLSLTLCVFALLWDSKNEFSAQEKKKNPLFITAGIFGILFLAFLLIPMMDDSSGTSESLFSALINREGLMGNNGAYNMAFAAVALSYALALLLGSLLALAISFVGKLRNNPKKALIAAIFYLFSLSVPSVILCLIGYGMLKKSAESSK